MQNKNNKNRLPFALSPPMLLLRAHESVVLEYRPVLRRHGVNEAQWRVLRVLSEVEAITASELASRANLLPPSLSRIMPVMESRGWLRRSSNAQDQRQSLVSLGAHGKSLLARAMPDITAAHAAMSSAFGKERLDRLLQELQTLHSLLAERRLTED
jgi:homoprotocatechuate degradation regulator HpaR